MAAQTSYAREFTRGKSGHLASSQHTCHPYTNGSGGQLEGGVAVAQKSATEGSADLFNTPGATVVGFTVDDVSHDPTDLTGDNVIQSLATMNVLEEGEIYVKVEETVAVGDPVYVRHTSDGGSNTVLGRCRKSADSNRARQLKGARWVKGGSSGGVAVLYFSATAEQAIGDAVEVVIDHPQVTADTTTKEFKTRSDRYFKVEKVQYLNPTGLLEDATNTFNIKLQTGAGPTVLANWDTTTGQQGTLTANTFVDMVLNATPANLVLAPDSEVSLFLDETNAATLPAGKVILHGRYL